MSKPGCGARRRALCHGVAGLAESRDGGRVPPPRGTLDMMRALDGGCTAGAERLGAPLVRAQSPAAGRRLVDRPPDERMPEAKAARHLGLPNEVELQQLVQGLEHRRLGGRCGGGSQLRLERVAGYRCPLQHAPCAVREQSELLGQRGRNRGRHVEILGRELGTACRALESERSRELLEIERVAAALLVESGRGGAFDRVAEKLPSLAARQRADFHAEQCPRAVRPLQRGGDALRRLTRSDSQRDEHGRGRRPSQQRAEQFHRPGVSPVEIVEHEHQRPARRQSLEQLAHGAVAAVALVLERCLTGRLESRERWKDERQLGADVVVECLEAMRREPRDVLVERVDEHPERQIPLELRCRPVQDELPTRVRPSHKLGEQTGLADPGLTHQRERGRPPTVELGERVVEHTARLGAPDELLAHRHHFRSRRA